MRPGARRARRIGAAGLAAWVSLAAGEAPPLIPTRDVDVTYDVPTGDSSTSNGATGDGATSNRATGGGAAARGLTERLRWDTAGHRLRVDPPGNGVYMITDYTAHRMSIVRDASRSIIEALAPAAALPGNAHTPYQRQGGRTLAGLDCTDWATIDTEAHPVVICVTADGVLLGVTRDNRTVLAARRVVYGPQNPALFTLPADYRRTSATQPGETP